MTDRDTSAERFHKMTDAAPSFPDIAFPSEAFPCPACGQMLAPSCRVCVACRQPIDPALIKTAPLQTAPAPHEGIERLPVQVRFPWLLFAAFLVILVPAFGLAQYRWGVVKTQLVFYAAEALCAAWVFYDASRSGVPRPFRWMLGTLFLWLVIFPWYLVRRRTPRALCPFVEGVALPIVLLVVMVLGVVYALVTGPIK